MSVIDHPDYRGFLAAIRATPADDLPRLALADWLDERGEHARAEFIRVQCELARMDEAGEGEIDPNEGHTCWQSPCPVCELVTRRKGLAKRARALITELRPAIRDGLPRPFALSAASRRSHELEWGVCSGRHFPEFSTDDYMLGVGRGFVEAVACPAAVWLAHADAIRATHPITAVTLTTVRGRDIEDLCERHRREYPGEPLPDTCRSLLFRLWPGIAFTLSPPTVTFAANRIAATVAVTEELLADSAGCNYAADLTNINRTIRRIWDTPTAPAVPDLTEHRGTRNDGAWLCHDCSGDARMEE